MIINLNFLNIMKNRNEITAAHCFYNQEKQTMRDAGDYEIFVGKITRDREILDTEVTRIYKVNKTKLST